MEKLNILIISGTARKNSQTAKVSEFIAKIGSTLEHIDINTASPSDYDLPNDGNSEEIKNSEYSNKTKNADAFFIVTPEYNHSYPGSLKRLLDTEFSNYHYKPVLFAGVSSGYMGGVRAIESLLPVIRKFRMFALPDDIYFHNVDSLFDEDNSIKDLSYKKRVEERYEELVNMGRFFKKMRKE